MRAARWTILYVALLVSIGMVVVARIGSAQGPQIRHEEEMLETLQRDGSVVVMVGLFDDARCDADIRYAEHQREEHSRRQRDELEQRIRRENQEQEGWIQEYTARLEDAERHMHDDTLPPTERAHHIRIWQRMQQSIYRLEHQRTLNKLPLPKGSYGSLPKVVLPTVDRIIEEIISSVSEHDIQDLYRPDFGCGFWARVTTEGYEAIKRHRDVIDISPQRTGHITDGSHD